MKNYVRSERRFHLARMKKRAMTIYHDWPNAYKCANHIKLCSSYCCGNPRKWFHEKTLQELKAEISYCEQIGNEFRVRHIRGGMN